MIVLYVLLVFVSVVFRGCHTDDLKPESKKIVCYWASYSKFKSGNEKFTVNNIDPFLCTHILHSTASLNDQLNIVPFGSIAEFAALKSSNAAAKLMVSVGGWNINPKKYSAVTADPNSRSKFVQNAIAYLRSKNLDGIDLDWDFGDNGPANEKQNFATLIKEFGEAFENEAKSSNKERLLLTITLPFADEKIEKYYDFSVLNRYVDFMNLMSFDYHNGGEENTMHPSPMYPLDEKSSDPTDSRLNVDYTVKSCIEKGANPAKLVLGIATYGRCWQLKSENVQLKNFVALVKAGMVCAQMTYIDICESINVADYKFKVYRDNKNIMGPYAYSYDISRWVGYDDVDSVKMKAEYAKNKGLGGVMFFTMDKDDFNGICNTGKSPLIEAAKSVLLPSREGKFLF